jgi:hypothetical protein
MGSSNSAIPSGGIIEVEGPDGTIYEFPQGTPVDQMHMAMAKQYPKPIIGADLDPNADMTPSLGNAWSNIKSSLSSPMIPAERMLRGVLPKERMSDTAETAAGIGLAGARTIENLSTPTTMALGLGAGLLGNVGVPGMIVTGGLSLDQIRRAYQEFEASQKLPKDALPRENVAGKGTALADAIFAALPWMGKRAGVKMPSKQAPIRSEASIPVLPSPEPVPAKIVAPAAKPVVQTPIPAAMAAPTKPKAVRLVDTPPVEKEPWYASRDRAQAAQKAKAEAEALAEARKPSEPLPPLPEFKPKNPPVKQASAKKSRGIQKSISLDLGESPIALARRLGGINPERIGKSGTRAEWYEGLTKGQRMQILRKDSTNSPDDMVAQFKENGYPNVQSESELIQLFKNPNYRSGQKIASEEEFYKNKAEEEARQAEEDFTAGGEPWEPDLAAPSEGPGEFTPEDWKLILKKFGGEEGFADITRKQLIDSIVKTKGGKYIVEQQLKSDGGGWLLMKPDGGIEWFNSKPQAETHIKKLEGKNLLKEEMRVGSIEWRPIGWKKGESGFADTSKNQEGFDFTALNIPGQSKEKAAAELFNKILQAPDSNTSKRDLLGLNKKKSAKKEPSDNPLFK